MPSSHTLRSCFLLVVLGAVGACAADGGASAADGQAPAVLAQQSSTPSAAPFGCDGTKIALATRSGYYVGAFFGGGFGMIATARKPGQPESFTSIDLGKGRVALQASSGHYVTAENGGGGSVYANANALGSTTSLILDGHPDGESITLRTPSGFYLNALLGGGTVMNINTRAPGDWEALQVICLDGDIPDPDDDAADPVDSDDASSADDPSGDEPDEPEQPKPGLGG